MICTHGSVELEYASDMARDAGSRGLPSLLSWRKQQGQLCARLCSAKDRLLGFHARAGVSETLAAQCISPATGNSFRTRGRFCWYAMTADDGVDELISFLKNDRPEVWALASCAIVQGCAARKCDNSVVKFCKVAAGPTSCSRSGQRFDRRSQRRDETDTTVSTVAAGAAETDI